MPLDNRYRTFPWIHFLEQRAVARFFTLKGMSPKDIHTGLMFVYMNEALCLCTIYKWYEHFMQERTELCDDRPSGRPFQNDLADALRAMIQEFSFTSCKRLCIHFRLAKSICLHIWHDVLRLKKFNLRWFSHSRWRSKGRTGFTFHRPFESSQRKLKNDFVQVIAGNESRFISTIFINRSASRPEMMFQKQSKNKLVQKEPHVGYLVDQRNSQFARWPQGTRDNSTFFCDVIILDLLENVHTQPKTEPERNLDGCWQCTFA
jgi:hypothetical protein